MLVIGSLIFSEKINVKDTFKNCDAILNKVLHQATSSATAMSGYDFKCPECVSIYSNTSSYAFYEWMRSVCYSIGCRSETENGNKIYVANNKVMSFYSEMNNNLSREALKFNKLLYFAWAFHGRKKMRKEKNYSYFKSHKEVFPFLKILLCEV